MSRPAAWAEAAIALDPRSVTLQTISIEYGSPAQTARFVNDTVGHTLAAQAHTPTRFDLRVLTDGGRRPETAITIANVGREFTAIAEASRGGEGVTLVASEWLWNPADASPDATAVQVWTRTLQIASVDVDVRRASVRLLIDPADGRQAVAVRYDRAHAPYLH